MAATSNAREQMRELMCNKSTNIAVVNHLASLLGAIAEMGHCAAELASERNVIRCSREHRLALIEFCERVKAKGKLSQIYIYPRRRWLIVTMAPPTTNTY